MTEKKVVLPGITPKLDAYHAKKPEMTKLRNRSREDRGHDWKSDNIAPGRKQVRTRSKR